MPAFDICKITTSTGGKYVGGDLGQDIIAQPSVLRNRLIYTNSLKELPLVYQYEESTTDDGVFLVPTGKIFYKTRTGKLREIEKIFGVAPGPYRIVFKKNK